MLKAYVLVFNDGLNPRQQVLDYLDTLPAVKHWFAVLPAAIFLASPETAHNLAAALRVHFGANFFFISEIPKGTNNGWLPQNNWDFINNPTSSGRWP